MPEVAAERVTYVIDPTSNKGKYFLLPDADWNDTGNPAQNEQHPDSKLSFEEILALPEVVWVATPDTLEQVDLDPQTVPMKDYAAGAGGPITITHTTPANVEGFTELQDGEFGYTFGPRKTQKGGGYFQLASDTTEDASG